MTVDMLRGLNSSRTVVFDNSNKTLREAGIGHSIASFFGTKTAKETNRETLAAIKDAVLSDARYFGVRKEAVQWFSSFNASDAIDSTKIKNLVTYLDSISEPQQQKEQLSEIFALHLANRGLPAGWSEHTRELQNYLSRNVDSFISDPARGLGSVNPSLVIEELCQTLEVISEVAGTNSRVIDLAAALLAGKPQLIDTPEKARDVMTRWVKAINGGNAGTKDNFIDTIFSGSAGDDGDSKISLLKDQMKILQFCQSDGVPQTLTDPDVFLRNFTNEKAKSRLTSNLSRSLSQFAKGEVTFFKKDIVRSLDVTLPNGVRLPRGYELAREEIAKYITGSKDATFAGLDEAAKHKAWLLMSLLTQEIKQIAVVDVPCACIPGSAGCFFNSAVDDVQSFVVSENENGDWVITNKMFREVKELILLPDVIPNADAVPFGRGSKYDASIEIHIPKAEIDRIAAFSDSELAEKNNAVVSLNTDVSVSSSLHVAPPLDTESAYLYDIAHLPESLGLTNSEKEVFESAARYEISARGTAEDAFAVLTRADSFARRLISYPALFGSQELYEHCKELMKTFDQIFDAHVNAGFKEKYKATLEQFIFDELSSIVESGNKLPSLKEFEKSLSVKNPYFDFSRWGFESTEMVYSLLEMPAKYRQPIIASLKTFYESTDMVLFNRLVGQRDAIVNLHKQDKLTVSSIYKTIVGEDAPVPFAKTTPEDEISKYFQNSIYGSIEQYLSEKPDEYIASSETYFLMRNYQISVEDAFAIALNRRSIGAESLKLNPYQPFVFQPIGRNSEAACDQLAMDLPRMIYGYTDVKTGHKANIPSGSFFTFHLPSGVDATFSSEPIGMDDEELQKYKNGKATSLTNLLKRYMEQLCGQGRDRQIATLLLGLGQACKIPLRSMSGIYGIEANEHSQVKIDLRKIENGDVELIVTNPENCPLEFAWTLTVSPNGGQKMSEITMRRAENSAVRP